MSLRWRILETISLFSSLSCCRDYHLYIVPYDAVLLQRSMLIISPTYLLLSDMFQGATRLSSPPEASEGILFASSLDKPLSLRQLLTYPVFISVANYTYLKFLDSSNSTLLPLFFATPIEIGGLGFEPRRIGYILGAYQAVTAVFMATYFSKAVRYLGERRTYVLAMATSQLCWVLFPVMNLCARHYGISTSVWTGIVFWVLPTTSSEMAFSSLHFLFSSSIGLRMLSQLPGCIYVFITAAAPNRRSLGAIHGLSQTAVSIASIITPSLSTSLFSFSVEWNLLGGYAVYAVFSFLSCFAVWLAMRLPHEVCPAWEGEEESPRRDEAAA